MEYFLPSEIARLVLGYLKEEGCEKAYKAFLSESPHLQEYATLLKRGRQYPTSIYGKSLQDMVHMYGLLHSKDLIEKLKQQISDSRHDDESGGSKLGGCADDVSDAASSSIGAGPKFNLSSDSDDNPSTPTDTEDSGVASTTHSTAPRTSPSDWRISSYTGMKASRIPRPKPKTKLVKRCGKSSSQQRSPKRSPLRCSLSPVKASTSNSVTPLNTHRTEPNRTKDYKKSHNRERKAIFPQEISSILPCNDESVHLVDMSPMLSSTRQSFIQSSGSVKASSSEDKSKQSSQTTNSCSNLRALLSAPAAYSVTSTPRTNTSSAAKQDSLLTITISSPSRPPSTRSGEGTPARKRQPSATVTRVSSVETSTQSSQQPPEAEEPVDTSSQISDADAAEMRSFGFKTALKRNVDSPASSIGIGKSPRRKCSAPKRRSQGADVVLVPPTPVKPITIVTSSAAVQPTSASITHVVPSCSTTIATTVGVDNPNPDDIPAVPIVEEIVSNRNLVEKLAETINKHVRFDLGRSTPTQENQLSENKPDFTDGTTQHSTNSDSLDAILDLGGSNIDEALQEIVDHTKNEPAFDSLFKMFNVDKYKFIEEEYGEPAPTTCSGLITPPCPVLTGVATSTTNTYTSEPCDFGSVPPENKSLLQPAASYASDNTIAYTPSTQSTTQQTHPPLQSTLQSAVHTTCLNSVLTQPPLPITFIPVAELRPAKKTNDPSKIKTSGAKVSNNNGPIGSLTLMSDLPVADDLPGIESMPVLHIDDCDPNSEDVLMGRVHTASIIHPSVSGNSPDVVETVRIVGYELPKDCQQLINENANDSQGLASKSAKDCQQLINECTDTSLKTVAEKDDPVYEQLKEARKPGTSRGKPPSIHAPPKKQGRFRNCSSPAHLRNSSKGPSPVLNSDSLSSHDSQYNNMETELCTEGAPEPVPLFPATSGKEVSSKKETGYVSDGIDRTSVCSMDSSQRRTRNCTEDTQSMEQQVTEPEESDSESVTRRPRTRSSTRSQTASRDTSLESVKNDVKTKPVAKRNSQRKREEETKTDKDHDLSSEVEKGTVSKGRKSRSKSRKSRAGKSSSKKKTKIDKTEQGTAEQQDKNTNKTLKENTARDLDSAEEKNRHKPDAVEESLGMREVVMDAALNSKLSNTEVQQVVNDVSSSSKVDATDGDKVQSVDISSGDVSQEQHVLNDSHDDVIFQTPNEYNKSIGLSVSDADLQHEELGDITGESTLNVEGNHEQSKTDSEHCEKRSQSGKMKDDKKGVKKKITRKKIKRETGPLTIAAKKADYAKANTSAVSDCNASSQEPEAVTPAFNAKKVPFYIAPTPSPGSSFSSASMTPKHVRMLDFGLAQTPPGLPGQSPPISSIGAQVTLGFKSPVYAQLGTPGSVHSQGGNNTPNGSECGFVSPAYQPSPTSCESQTPNSQQDVVPPFLADHVFGQFSTDMQGTTNGNQVVSETHNYETPSKPSCVPEESEASRFAASLSKVESPHLIRALANTIGIPTEDSVNNTPKKSKPDIIVSPPELPNFGRGQSAGQMQVLNGKHAASDENTEDAAAAEALIAMANTPVKGQQNDTVKTGHWRHSETIVEQHQAAPEGSNNEDSSSSSVSSSVLMPPPTMTPRRNIYKTPKKQMILTANSVSPAKSPGLKCLMEASLMSELSQSPRTSQKNLDMMDEFLNSTILGSPSFKQNTPMKLTHGFKFGTPVKESPMKSLLETPSKSLEAFVAQFSTPQKNVECTPQKETETASNVEAPNEGNLNVSKDTPKKKKKKSKDKIRDWSKEREIKKTKSKKKDKDIDHEASDSAGKEKKKKSKHKRSRSKREATEAFIRAEALKLLTQTPLGNRSPMVCGMSPPHFDMNSNSPNKALGDIALLMAQVQSPSKIIRQMAATSDGVDQGTPVTVESSAENGTTSSAHGKEDLVMPSASYSAASANVTSDRKPLAEKSTASEKGEVKRGKKRHRHREDKEDTTPEKKKQKRNRSATVQKQISELDMSAITSFLDVTHATPQSS